MGLLSCKFFDSIELLLLYFVATVFVNEFIIVYAFISSLDFERSDFILVNWRVVLFIVISHYFVVFKYTYCRFESK